MSNYQDFVLDPSLTGLARTGVLYNTGLFLVLIMWFINGYASNISMNAVSPLTHVASWGTLIDISARTWSWYLILSLCTLGYGEDSIGTKEI